MKRQGGPALRPGFYAAEARQQTPESRACPFCESMSATLFGRRRGEMFVRCTTCGSVFRDITAAQFDALHETAQGEEEFVEKLYVARGLTPYFYLWDEMGLPGGSVLEIGPGSGHLLAAARDRGLDVYGVETNPLHRKFISEAWGIDTVVETIDELPADLQVDIVVSVNVFEHVYDIDGFLKDVTGPLRPGGRLYMSTVNADALCISISRVWNCMFKDIDHVTFPTEKGIRLMARRAGLGVDRIWTGELSFETPIALALALRDWYNERKPADEEAEGEVPPLPATTGSGRVANALTRFSESSIGPYEPSHVLTSRLGRAQMIRMVLTR